MIVADASAIVNSLIEDGEARGAMSHGAVAVPHAADAEVTAALGSAVARRQITAERGREALFTWMALGCDRFGVTGLLNRVWQLRENVGAYDAIYVALAEALDCELLTADVQLAQAAGPRCAFAIARN